MYRGTTPTITFETDCNCSTFEMLEIAFAQGEDVIFVKKLDDCVIDGNKIRVTLSEEDTLLFDSHKGHVKMQIRAGIGNKRISSNIMQATAKRILKDGCLE